MVAKNDITGDNIQSRTSTKQYQDNYDRIFRKTPQEIDDAKNEDEAFSNIEQLNKLRDEK
jgi:hypothetical protein